MSFFYILYRNKTFQVALGIDERKLLDLVAAEYLLRLLKSCAFGSGNKVILGHDILYTDIIVVEKAYVAVGKNTDQLFTLAYRNAGDSILLHKGVCIVDIMIF